MNTQFKRIAAFLMAVLCMVSLTAAVFADGDDGTGSIVAADGTTVNGAGESAQETDSIIDANTLKAKIDSYLSEQGVTGNNKVFSVGYCYTATGDTWYYDGDQWCYSASLYKVPCCMLLAEKEYNGEITADTQITSQYASGTVDYMERKSIVNSDNYTGHAVVEYLGGTYNGKCSDQTIKFTDLPADYFPSDFTDYSYYSAKYYTQVLNTLYTNSDKYPRIMDYMKQDQSYHYLDKDLEGQYEVAQKYGAFEEKNGNKNYHSAGIVYTPNPVIITILTKNITSFEKHIGAVAKILVDYTLELDSQLATYNANKIIAQQQEAARLAQEEQQRLAQEAAAQQAAATQTTATQQSTAQQSDSQQTAFSASQVTGTTSTASQTQSTAGSGSIFLEDTSAASTQTSSSEQSGLAGKLSSVFSLPVIIGLLVVVIIFIVVLIVKLRNAKMDDEEFDDEEYEEYMRGDISDLAPRQEKQKKSLFGSKKKDKDALYDEEDDDLYDNAQYGKQYSKQYSKQRGRQYDDQLDDRYDDQDDQKDVRYDARRSVASGKKSGRLNTAAPAARTVRTETDYEEDYNGNDKEDYKDSYKNNYKDGYNDNYNDNDQNAAQDTYADSYGEQLPAEQDTYAEEEFDESAYTEDPEEEPVAAEPVRKAQTRNEGKLSFAKNAAAFLNRTRKAQPVSYEDEDGEEDIEEDIEEDGYPVNSANSSGASFDDYSADSYSVSDRVENFKLKFPEGLFDDEDQDLYQEEPVSKPRTSGSGRGSRDYTPRH